MGKKWNDDKKEAFKKLAEQSPARPSFRSSKKSITGNIASLGNHVFYLGGNADKSGYHYERTIEKLAEYIQAEYGNMMWILVTTGAECRPTEPKALAGTRATSNSWAVDRYKLEYAHYLKLLEDYDHNKAQIFAVIYGQCTDAMKSKLKSHSDHNDLSRNANVIKLLKRIKKLMMGENSEQYSYWTMTLSLVRSATCRQGAKESLESYYVRWCTQMKILESKWGHFGPAKNPGKEKFQACLFLHSLNQDKYQSILEELNNSFLQGYKSYPNSPDAAMKLVSQWMNSKNRKMQHHDDKEATKLSFVQTEEVEEEDETEEEKDIEEISETEETTETYDINTTWQF